MNKFERLYEIKKDIESQIMENTLFKLSRNEAIYTLFKKIGTINYLFYSMEDEKISSYIKLKCKTTATEINQIKFIKQSIMWIIRWCYEYCEDEKTGKTDSILYENVIDLMGIAYSYDTFYSMWQEHNFKKVYSAIDTNKVMFNYKNEETYKIHLFYDTFTRMIADSYDRSKLPHTEDLSNVLDIAHTLDYTTSFQIDFGEFTLSEYRVFSKALNSFLAEDLMKSMARGSITVNDVGVYKYYIDTWITIIKERSNLNDHSISSIINFLLYNPNEKNADISLSYFVKVDEYFLLSEPIFNLTRPEINLIRLLAKRNSKKYDFAQNKWEEHERNIISEKLRNRYTVTYGKDKKASNIPGFDVLVYDEKSKRLQVIELKYRLPVDSVQDIDNLDVRLLNKAYRQIEEAKEYYSDNRDILKIFFGKDFAVQEVKKVDFFIVTNYSIGSGFGYALPTPILERKHYLNLMSMTNGMEKVSAVLADKRKKLPIKEEKKRLAKYHIFKYKILIPEYMFKP